MNHFWKTPSHAVDKNTPAIEVISNTQKHTQEQVHQLLDLVFSQLSRSLLQSTSEFKKYSLSFLQYFLLQKIQDGDFLTMSDIADKLWYTNAATTGQIDRLEKLGYVLREYSKSDRRKIIVTITEKWHQTLKELNQYIHRQISQGLTGS